jgi:WD40 repeat protein/transcriptional regulator with XRE-family HTH domain
MNDFTRLLDKLREERQISQKELASRAGLSAGYISLLTRGERRAPSIETVKALADALNLDSENRTLLLKAAGFLSFSDSTIITDPLVSTFFLSNQSDQLNETRKEEWGGAPDVRVFYGRKQELENLEQWIVDDQCRVVAMVGLGGVGKTTLAVQLAKQVKNQFENILWLPLQNAPTLEIILRKCILFLSKQQRFDLPKDIDDQISLIISFLREHSCLIVLDNFESVFQGSKQVGEYRNGFEGYGKLIKSIGETEHRSCLIMTSREKPKEVALLEGKESLVRTWLLEGLKPIDGQGILKNKGLFGSEDTYEALIRHYAGNPLALKLVSQFIQEVFNGDIASFLGEEKVIFSDIRDILGQQFERLSPLEQEIVYWLAIEREAIPLNKLQENLLYPIAERELQEAIRSLKRRSFIIMNTMDYTLESVILEFVTDQFVKQICDEIEKGIIELFARYALIQAQAKDYIRNFQINLILSPIAQWLELNLGTEGSHKKLISMLSTLREMNPLKTGYAAGNAINLLVKMGIDLRGSDFSYLRIRQAYLQDVDLHEVNFSYADLATSVFNETFGSVLAVTFSPDGNLMAAGTANGDVRLWQVPSGIPFLSYQAHSDWVRSVTINSKGNMLASSSDDKTVRLWDVNTGDCLKTLQGHLDWVWSVAFSPSGNTIASCSHDKTVRLWDVNTGDCLKTLHGHSDIVYSVAFSPDGDTVASSSEDKTIRLWNIKTDECPRILQGHSSMMSVAFSPDGRTIVTGNHDHTVQLWDVEKGKCLSTLRGHHNRIWSVAFSPDGNTVASSSEDKTIRLWNIKTEECLHILQGHSNLIYAVAFSPQGEMVLSGGEDRSMRLWNVKAGECLKILKGYSSWICSIAFSPDGNIIVSGSQDKNVQLWDVRTGQRLKTFRGHSSGIFGVAFSPEGNTVASGSEDQTVRLWDVDRGVCVKILQEHTHWVYAVAFSPDRHTLASGSWDQTIRLWDITTGHCYNILQGFNSWVYTVAFSPDGHTLASGSEDQTVRLWDVRTGNCLMTLSGHANRIWSVAFSPDGHTLASGSEDQTVRLWDVRTGNCLKILQGHESWVRGVAFSPDGHTLASGSQDKTVRLWDVRTGNCLKILQGHESWVWSIGFNSDGRTVASGCHDGVIILWDIDTGECLHKLRSERPYENLNLSNVKGLNETQKINLISLGAIEH